MRERQRNKESYRESRRNTHRPKKVDNTHKENVTAKQDNQTKREKWRERKKNKKTERAIRQI